MNHNIYEYVCLCQSLFTYYNFCNPEGVRILKCEINFEINKKLPEWNYSEQRSIHLFAEY